MRQYGKRGRFRPAQCHGANPKHPKLLVSTEGVHSYEGFKVFEAFAYYKPAISVMTHLMPSTSVFVTCLLPPLSIACNPVQLDF